MLYTTPIFTICVYYIILYIHNTYMVNFVVVSFGLGVHITNLYFSAKPCYIQLQYSPYVCILYIYIHNTCMVNLGVVSLKSGTMSITQCVHNRVYRHSGKRTDSKVGSSNEWKSLCLIVRLPTNRIFFKSLVETIATNKRNYVCILWITIHN